MLKYGVWGAIEQVAPHCFDSLLLGELGLILILFTEELIKSSFTKIIPYIWDGAWSGQVIIP